MEKTPKDIPPQQQERHPGPQGGMTPKPVVDDPNYRGSGKLQGKVALVTGADSGIGQAVAVAFAKEGADVAVIYLEQHQDAEETMRLVEEKGRKAVLIAGDVSDPGFCVDAVERTVRELGRLDILVNNAGQQFYVPDIEQLSPEQIEKTFRVNIFSQFYMTRAAVKHIGEGGAIVNTTSITAYQGNPTLLDYSSTKGAILAFTRSLSKALLKRGIRVNAVAPGPIWTPFIPSSFPPEKVESFGKDTPMQRPGQPFEVAPAYVFLASNVDASYITGQTIHVNGGEFISS